jgi:hypothetical protein
VTVPVRTNFFDISNMAEGEWCAHKAPAAKRTVETSNARPKWCRKAILLPKRVRSISQGSTTGAVPALYNPPYLVSEVA